MPQVNLSLKEIYQKLCPECQKKVRDLVKEKVSDEDASAKISKTITTHTDPTNGESKITLTYTDTALTCKNYIYDLQVKTDEGEIKTLLEGVITIKQDITIRTS